MVTAPPSTAERPDTVGPFARVGPGSTTPPAHAELLSRAVDAEGAARAYERAIALSGNAVERAELGRRLRALR
jgi:hypothetical protein